TFPHLTMLRRSVLLAFAAILVSLALSSKAQAWGCYHVGYTHYSPYTGFHHYGASNVIHVVGVAAVDEDVAGLEMRREVGDGLVHDGGRDHQPDRARLIQFLHELCERGGPHGLLLNQFLYGFRRPVEDHALVALLEKASHHVRAHPAESDHSELHCRAPFKCEMRIQGSSLRHSDFSFRICRIFLPKPKPSQERIGVVAFPATWRQLFQLLHVTSPQDHIVGLEGGDQEGYHVRYILRPLLLSSPIQSANAHIILIGALLVRQMAQLHRLDDAVQNHGSTQTRSQAQEKHLAALVAPQSLHGRIIDDLDWAPECCSIVEPHPTRAEAMPFCNRPAMQDP